ncbi:hypothetical protein HYQ46_007706 [Verticillium longisporum]|nr:hypothetical protein HYQ46_007706 [Verticillium longisporum]
MQSAPANGQPTTAPAANQAIPCDVLRPPRQFMKAVAPSMLAYMAKLEGRKAVLAWKFPALKTVAQRKMMPIRALRVVLTTRKRRTWHRAQAMART